MDDDGKPFVEVHRDYADYRCPEGVSVSPSSMSVTVDRMREPVEEIIGIAEKGECSRAEISFSLRILCGSSRTRTQKATGRITALASGIS